MTGFPAEVIGIACLHALTTANPKVRYAIVPNRLPINLISLGLMPMPILDKLAAEFMGIKRRS